MKPKLLVLLVVFSLVVTTYASTITTVAASDDSIVKVAVYYEAERIDSSEKAKIVDAIGVVESRFENLIGYKVDLEIVGSWTSRKDTTDASSLLDDAISKTSGEYTTFFDNCKYEGYSWKFKKSGYIAAIYVVEQDITDNDKGLHGAASPVTHAGIVDYNPHGCDHPFDRLCSVIQHELSHIFGITKECNEPWCVMNRDYMPHVETIYWWIIPIGRNETWATDWCQNCKNRLRATYNGVTYRYTLENTYVGGYYDAFIYRRVTWTETYYHWNLTSFRLNSVYTYAMPIIRLSPRTQAVAPPSFTLSLSSRVEVEP